MSSSHAVVMQETTAADSTGMSQQVNTTTFGGLPMHIQLSDTLTSPNVAESAAILFSMSQGGTANAMFTQNIGDVIRLPIACLKADKDNLTNGSLGQVPKEDSSEAGEKSVGQSLTIGVPVSFPDPGQPSPSASSTHSVSQVLRFRSSGNAGDAMLSAINYNESEVLQEDPLYVGVNNNLSNLDDGILGGVGSSGNNTGSAFDLFDGDGNVNESYNMDTLSPHPFPDSANNFSISDGSLTISDSDSLSSKVDGRSLDSSNQGISKPKTKNRLPKAALSPGRLGIQCTLCPKAFNNSSALAKHKLTHSDERKYICNVCSKAFKRQDHLNGHLMTHREKKPYECHFDNCEKSYCDARSLKRHLENHHQQSPEAIHTALTIIAQSVAAQGGTVPKSLTLSAVPHTNADTSASNRNTYQQTLNRNSTTTQSVTFNATPYNAGGTPVSSPTYSNPPQQPQLFQFESQHQQKPQITQVQQQVIVKHKPSQQTVQKSQPQPPCPQPKSQSQLPPHKPQPQPYSQPIKNERDVTSPRVTQSVSCTPVSVESKPDPPPISKVSTASWHPDQPPVFTINQYQINAQAAQVNISNSEGPSPTYVQQVSPVTPIPPVVQTHGNSVSNPPVSTQQQSIWFNTRPPNPPKPKATKKSSGATESGSSTDDSDGAPKPKCNICDRRFKSIPALNGHMRLHGGYFKKDEEGKKPKKSASSSTQNATTLPHPKPISSTHLVSFARNSSLPSINPTFQMSVEQSNSTPHSPVEAPTQVLQLHSQPIDGGQPVQAVQIIQNVQLLSNDMQQNVSQNNQLQELAPQQKLLQHHITAQDQQEQLNQQAQINILEQLQQQQQSIHALHEQIQLQVQQLQQQQQQLQQNSLQQIQNADPAFQQQLQQQLQEQIQQQQQVQEQQIQQLQRQLQQQIEVHLQQQQQLQQVQQLQTTHVSEPIQLQTVSEHDVIQLTQPSQEESEIQQNSSTQTTTQIQPTVTPSDRVITNDEKKNMSNLDFLLAYQDQFIKENLREQNPSVSNSTGFNLQQPIQQIAQPGSNVSPFGPPLNVEVPPNDMNAHSQPLNLRTPPISLSSEAIQTSLQSVLAQMQLPQLSIQEVDNNVGSTNEENFDTDTSSIQPSKNVTDNNEMTVSQLIESMVHFDEKTAETSNQQPKIDEQPLQRLSDQHTAYNNYSTDDILSLLQSKSLPQKSDISISTALSSHFASNSSQNTSSSVNHPEFNSASSNIRKQLHQQIVSKDSVMAASSSSFHSSPVLGGSSNTFNINSLCDSVPIPGQFKPIKPDPTLRKRRYSCDTERTSPIKRSTTAPSNLIMLLNKGVSSGTLNKSGSNPNVEGKQRIRIRSKSGDSHGLLRSKSIEHTFMRPRSQTSEIFARPKDWLDSSIFSKSGTFRNPSVLPESFKFKRKHRPAPLYIPPHTNSCGGFPSRLRSPRIFEAGERKLGTPPPYTPPPMLSPMRSGSGLFWTLKPLTPKSAPGTPRGLLSAHRRSSYGGISIAPEEEEEDITEPLVEEEEPPPETDVQPHVNVGPMYQARLPVLNPDKSHALNSLSKESLVWNPKVVVNQSEEDDKAKQAPAVYLSVPEKTCHACAGMSVVALNADDGMNTLITKLKGLYVQCFQEFACSNAIKGGGCNIEYALHLLNIAKGNICKAMLQLMNSQPKLPKNHSISLYEYQETEAWSQAEIESFQQALHKYDKEFFRISKEVKTKSTRQCVLFYYLWKKACPEEYKRLRILRRKRENEELYNLRSNQNQTEPPPPQSQDLDESDSESSFERSDDHIDKDEEPDRPSSVPTVTITYPCSYPSCTASFLSKQSLLAHGKIHSTVKTNDVSRSPARRHNANPSPVLDNGISDTAFPCKVCGSVWEKGSCGKLCNGVFTKVKSRSAHMKIHRVDDSEKKQAKLDLLHSVSPEQF